jgi:catechol 2,3-dioxygenase-like lactoylglutathione lyase family enzyme
VPTTTQLNITKVGRVCVPTADTERALAFYCGTLGLEKVVDEPMGPDARWVEVAVPGHDTTIAIAPPPPGTPVGGAQTGIILDSTDIDADHAALKAAGADVDEEITRWGGNVPPMFWVRDPEGNALIVVQPAR